MSQIQVQKEKFMSYLEQFIDDVPYEIQLVKKLFDQLPSAAIEGFVTEYFYSHGFYKGTLYKIQHVIFKDDIKYFPTMKELLEFLKSYSLDSKISDALTERRVDFFIKNNQPICGYLIEKISNNNE